MNSEVIDDQAVEIDPTSGFTPQVPQASDGESHTTQAAGLAVATMFANFVAVICTIVFTRLLGVDGYGALATLINLGIILFVPGSALQVAAAREGTLGHLGKGPELSATAQRWAKHLLYVLVGVAAISVVWRFQLARVLNLGNHEWGAAAVPATALLWALVSVQRGLLQSQRAYRLVALSVICESLGRLAVGLSFVALGSGVTGAYLGTTASLVITAVLLQNLLIKRLGVPDNHTRQHPLRALALNAAVPITALTLVAALQNIDVIMAQHSLGAIGAGNYAVATVAAKALVWIAVGIGLWLLPEATRRASMGKDPRKVLLVSLGLICVLAAVALSIFAFLPELLVKIAFGPDFEAAADILLTLGIAYALLACTYLAVQFLLGLGRKTFIIMLAIAATAEPILLVNASSLAGFSHRVLIVEGVAAAAILLLALTTSTLRSTKPAQVYV